MEPPKPPNSDQQLMEKLRGIEGYKGLSVFDENLQEIHREDEPSIQAQEQALKHSKKLLEIDVSHLGLTGSLVIVLNRADERILVCESEKKIILLTTSRDAKVASFVDILIRH